MGTSYLYELIPLDLIRSDGACTGEFSVSGRWCGGPAAVPCPAAEICQPGGPHRARARADVTRI